MEQLTFELAPPEPPSFANFLAGPNAEAVTAPTVAETEPSTPAKALSTSRPNTHGEPGACQL